MDKKIVALFWFGVGGVVTSLIAFIALSVMDARSIRVETPSSVPVPAGTVEENNSEIPVPAK